MFQLKNEGGMVEQTAAFLQFDQEIYVASSPGLPACDRAEQANVSGTVASRNLKNLRSLRPD
jgi:hypothetical protein